MDKKSEFMTVGELARTMGTTVRTLQYYDKEGLLKPSAVSEGGRRLYSAKDMVRLHQILSFKYLGFSLEEIRSKLLTLDDPAQVAAALEHQQKAIEAQITELNEALSAVTALHEEVLAIQKVDFSKYAEIIELLKIGNEGYWVWKYFDEPLREHIFNRFSDRTEDALQIYATYQEVLEEALTLKRSGESPDSGRSLCLAEKWWDMILAFTGGDLSLISQLEAFNLQKDSWDNQTAEKQQEIDSYLNAALNCYLSRKGSEGTGGPRP